MGNVFEAYILNRRYNDWSPRYLRDMGENVFFMSKETEKYGFCL